MSARKITGMFSRTVMFTRWIAYMFLTAIACTDRMTLFMLSMANRLLQAEATSNLLRVTATI